MARRALFEIANEGTLFLDEITEIPLQTAGEAAQSACRRGS